MENEIKIHERLATLEAQMKTILENHLPHLQATTEKLLAKFWTIIILLVATLVGIVADLMKGT